jgi:hypothetical protein|tara:strand:- start:2265 stop:2447 length:183 start_codon:yes stop_codon:yes gene_type:complete
MCKETLNALGIPALHQEFAWDFYKLYGQFPTNDHVHLTRDELIKTIIVQKDLRKSLRRYG